METVEQRREEEPTTSILQGLNPLEANVNNIKQWQAMDLTLAKAREEAVNEGSAGISELASATVMACSTGIYS